MTKLKKMTRRSRTNRNQSNGKGAKSNPVNHEAADKKTASSATKAETAEKKSDFEKLIKKLEAGDFDSDSNMKMLFTEYQKLADSTVEASSGNEKVISEENEKLSRLNHQLRHEIEILKKELENMKQNQREQAELDQLIAAQKAALLEKETLLQELDQRLQFLSHQLQDIPEVSVLPDNPEYRNARAQILVNTILPNFYKKRLSMEIRLIEQVEADEADARLLELNLMRELIYYHETELKQLLKN